MGEVIPFRRPKQKPKPEPPPPRGTKIVKRGKQKIYVKE